MLCVCVRARVYAVALTLHGYDMSHCKWCHRRSIAEFKMAVDGGGPRNNRLVRMCGGVYFRPFSILTGRIKINLHSLLSLYHNGVWTLLFTCLTFNHSGSNHAHGVGIKYEWMSRGAPLTFSRTLLDICWGEKDSQIFKEPWLGMLSDRKLLGILSAVLFLFLFLQRPILKLCMWYDTQHRGRERVPRVRWRFDSHREAACFVWPLGLQVCSRVLSVSLNTHTHNYLVTPNTVLKELLWHTHSEATYI